MTERRATPAPFSEGAGRAHRPEGVRNPDPMLGRSRPNMRPVKPIVERVPGVPAHQRADLDPPTKPKRQRVVLGGEADRSDPGLRGKVELAQQTSWGEMLITDLISALLRWAMLWALVGVLLIGGLPLLLWWQPWLAALRVGQVPVAWIVLGVLAFPALFGIGHASQRMAQRQETAFIDMVET